MAEYLIINGTDARVDSVGTAATYDNDSGQGANAAHVFTAVLKGVQGNDISVAYADDATNPSPPVVTVTGTDISVAIDTGVTLASAVKTAIDAHPVASTLVTVANKAGNDGTGVVVTDALTELTGGTADYLEPGTQKVVECTDAELAAFVVAGCAAIASDSTYQERRRAARTLKYDAVLPVHVAD